MLRSACSLSVRVVGRSSTAEHQLLFSALKAPAAARALPELGERARSEGRARSAEALLATQRVSLLVDA
jgi:hypothetical protein